MGALQFGIIGMGRHGARYINHIISDIEGIELVSVCRRDRNLSDEFLKMNPDVQFFSDYRELVKGDLDAVGIATPTALHKEMAIASMEAGLDVILEKPMAGDVEACERIMKVEKETGRKLMIAQTLRYCPVWKKMKELVKDLPFPEWFEMVQYLEPPKTSWLLDKEMAQGGCLLNTGVHVFDSFRFIFDAPIKRVECTIERSLNPVWEDFAYGNIFLSGGIEGSFKIARDSKYRARTMRIDYEGGLLYGDSLDAKLTRMDDGEEKNIDVGEKVNTIIPLLKDFSKCLKNNKDPPITSEDGLEAVRVARACYKSAERGEEVIVR
jgi:predicted dehydrogenase